MICSTGTVNQIKSFSACARTRGSYIGVRTGLKGEHWGLRRKSITFHSALQFWRRRRNKHRNRKNQKSDNIMGTTIRGNQEELDRFFFFHKISMFIYTRNKCPQNCFFFFSKVYCMSDICSCQVQTAVHNLLLYHLHTNPP